MRWAGGLGSSRRRAFEELLEPHLDSLLFHARRFTSTEEDAEDLLQDALVKAYRAFDRFTPGTSFRSWILKIVSNAAIDRFRKKGRTPGERSFGDALAEAIPAAESEPPLDPEALERFLPDEIVRAIDSLRPDYRALIVLRDLQDLSYKGIAATLGIPMGTVMSGLFLARGALRKALQRYAEAEGYVKRASGSGGGSSSNQR